MDLLLNPGNHDEGETPVPIPNTEAKPLGADGTARAAEWESRILPGFYFFGINGEGAQRPTPFSSRRIKESEALALTVGGVLLSFISIAKTF